MGALSLGGGIILANRRGKIVWKAP
jgi:hypothetical protein